MMIAVIGGGPAGLRAAEVAAFGGASVCLFEAKPSVGRKFLVAGRGGLNITKDEPLDRFTAVYEGPDLNTKRWREMIAAFDNTALRAWAASLGIETFAASTGRVYPKEMKAAPLLRRWVHRLKEAGVKFAMNHRLVVIAPDTKISLRFETPEGVETFAADAVILALGGGSWPETGSDGRWIAALEKLGIAVAPLEPANCGWELAWPPGFLAVAEGQPLKNIGVRSGGKTVRGELMITRYGLEGGAIYALGAELRAMASPQIEVDLKPDSSCQQLTAKMGPIRKNFLEESQRRWRLPDPVVALIRAMHGAREFDSASELARYVKAVPIPLERPRPIAEAISSAGGVRWSEVDDSLMLRKAPGVFVAGEMIDWEAPTGGYLMQGCFASGTRAAESALQWVRAAPGDA